MIKQLFYILFGGLIFSFMALNNKFPLLVHESAYYIDAKTQKTFFDQSDVCYALFVKYVSFNYSLWFIVFSQSLLLSGLIFIYFEKFCASIYRFHYFLAAVFLLTFFSPLSLLACSIGPAIFPCLGLLALGLAFSIPKFNYSISLTSGIILFLAFTDQTLLLTVCFISILTFISGFYLVKRNFPLSANIHLKSKYLILITMAGCFISFLSNDKFAIPRDQTYLFHNIAVRLVDVGNTHINLIGKDNNALMAINSKFTDEGRACMLARQYAKKINLSMFNFANSALFMITIVYYCGFHFRAKSVRGLDLFFIFSYFSYIVSNALINSNAQYFTNSITALLLIPMLIHLSDNGFTKFGIHEKKG